MSTVAPPPQAPLQPQLPSAAQVTATVVKAPTALARLSAGALLDATVMLGTTKGEAQLDSPMGKFALRTTFPLPAGAQLALQVAQAGPRMQLRMLSLNGNMLAPALTTGGKEGTQATGLIKPQIGQAQTPPGQPQAAAPQGAATPQPATPQTVQGATVTLTQSHGLQATVIRGAPVPVPGAPTPTLPQGQVPQLPTGTQLTVRIAAVQVPQSSTPGTVPQSSMPVQGTPVQTQAAPQQTASATPTLPGQPVAGTVAAGSTPVMTMTGTLAANTAGNQSIVNTPQGMIQLATKIDLPPGTLVTIDVTQTAPPPPPTAPMAAPQAGGPPLTGTQGWPALDQAMETLGKTNPQLAQQLRDSIPHAGPRLAATMMVMATAIRTGDARSWPGEASLKGLEKAGAKGLAQRLSDDVSELSKAARDSGRGEWRAMALPFANGAEIEKIMLYVHRDPEEGEGEGQRKKEDGTRFLINLDLTKMGPLQLDGYVVSKDRRFDLIVRTKQALNEDIRHGLLGVYTHSLDSMGINGNASFQVTKKFVEPEAPQEGEDMGPGLMV